VSHTSHSVFPLNLL